MSFNVAEIASRVASPIRKENFPIFVFGPYLLPGTKVPKPRSNAARSKHSLFVRYHTKTILEANGFPVQFGESSEVLSIWQQHIHLADTATSEISHADKICGAVVIFASSIGSFCELGLFASYEHIITKTLVIIDSVYENDKSFLNEGLVKLVKQENGQVIYCDYTDHEHCSKIALEFTLGKYTKLTRDYMHVEQAIAKMKRFPIS